MTAHPNDPAARERQARHARLLGFGMPAVERAAQARLVVVGAGGLGCPALRVLAAAGLGRLTIIDDDRVERSNLARQNLYTELDVGHRKAEAAVAALRHFAPGTELRAGVARLDAGSAAELLRGADAVLDTTDHWPTRFAVADACRELRIPLVWGSVLAWDGLLTTFAPGGPALDDFVDRATQLDAPPRDCAAAGVFAPLCAEIGAAMAGEGLRIAAGLPPLLVGRVRSWDAARGAVREVPLATRPGADATPRERTGSTAAPQLDPSTGPIPIGQEGSRRRRLSDAIGALAASLAPPRLDPLADAEGVPRRSADGLTAADVVIDVRPEAHPPIAPRLPGDYLRAPLERLATAAQTGRLDELVPLTKPLVVVCALGPALAPRG